MRCEACARALLTAPRCGAQLPFFGYDFACTNAAPSPYPRKGGMPPPCDLAQPPQVRKTLSRPRSWANTPTAAFYGCIPTEIHEPTCIFWASLTPPSPQYPMIGYFDAMQIFRTANVTSRLAAIKPRAVGPSSRRFVYSTAVLLLFVQYMERFSC